jgi:hypothetical protein
MSCITLSKFKEDTSLEEKQSEGIETYPAHKLDILPSDFFNVDEENKRQHYY